MLATQLQDFTAAVTTHVTIEPQHFSHSAGLVVFYDNENFAYLRVYRSESLGLERDRHRAGRGRIEAGTAPATGCPSTPAKRPCGLGSTTGTLQFSWRRQTATFQPVGPVIDATYMSDETARGFTGTMIGIACVDSFRKDLFAHFDYFRSAARSTGGRHLVFPKPRSGPVRCGLLPRVPATFRVWMQDLDLMAAAHFTVIRVGESVWSTWEPENGVFDLDWLQPVLDGAHARGIGVILGTPTYAVPPWLARLYPEINVERRTGQRMGWGARQEIDYIHPAFLFHAERVIRRIIARYVGHPAVIGFQVDNEPGNEIFYNHSVFQRFVDHLRRQYGSVEEINEQWGLTYWSHRLATWADLWTPDANLQPQYALAWRRFQASLTTEFIGWQADIVREYARDDQFVTTCISYERRTVQDDAVTRRLDIASGNPYYRMQDHLALPSTASADVADQGVDHAGHLGAVPNGRPNVLLPAAAIPGGGNKCAGHRPHLAERTAL